MIIFVKLLLTHLLGDFVFQSKSWIEDKERKRYRSSKLVLHAAIHGLLAWLFIFQINFWIFALVISVTHWLIDYIKITFQNESNKTKWFIADQLMHLLVLIIIAVLWTGTYDMLGTYWNDNYWIYITALIFVTFPSSIIIKTLISDWNPKSGEKYTSLSNAGKWIGIMERLFIFFFILSDHWEAIGFLLAAKSIFRFGDLKEAHDIKLTEYILIGTLLSFGIAIFTGALVKRTLI